MIRSLFLLGLVLMIMGIILASLAPLVYLASKAPAKPGPVEISGGACVVILFVPICFGYGSHQLVQTISLIGLLMAVLALLLILAFRRAWTMVGPSP